MKEIEMDSDPSGWLWFIVDVVLVLLLAGGIAYGTMTWRGRSRDPVMRQMRDDKTRELYERGAREEREAERRGAA
jgi:hypothetical protein